MSKRIVCKGCGNRFTKPDGSSRLNCTTCRPPRVQVPVDAPVGSPAAPVVPRAPGEIEVATRVELERCGRLVTVSGAIAVRLAHAMDDPALPEARLSSLASQLERTMERATAGVKAPPDELTARQARIRAVAETA